MGSVKCSQDTSALNYSAEVSGQFGTDLYEALLDW